MSVMAETSQLAIRPYVAMAAVGSVSYAWTAVRREALVVKVPGGNDGGEGGDGNGTTKELVPCLPFAREKLCPKPGAAHSAPFQPSPYESVMSRVHVAPRATANGELDVYGLPPLSMVPSEQLRLQPTSLCHDPPEQVIAEDMVGGNGGLGAPGGWGGDCGGSGEEDGDGGDSGGDGGGGEGGSEGGSGGDGGHTFVSSAWLVPELHIKHGVATLVSPSATHSPLT